MRWSERAPTSRDELDALPFHFAHQPQREFNQPSLVVRKSASKPALTGSSIGRGVRPGKVGNSASAEPLAAASGSTRAAEDSRTAAASGATSLWPQAPSSFLVCAGKSVGSNNDDEPSGSLALQPERLISASSCSDPMKKAPTQSRQRSDSELELIISELREKISLQHRLDEEKRKAAAIANHTCSEVSANGTLDSSRSTGSSSEPHHPRRHLKNPVERVHGNNPQVGGSLGLSMSSSSSISLKRQPSSSSEMVARLAPPTVIATGIGTFSSSLSRANLATSASSTGTLLHHSSGSILNDRDLEAHSCSRSYDEEGMLIKSYAQEPNNKNDSSVSTVQRLMVYHSNVVRARRVRRPTPLESERKGFSLPFEPQQQRQSGNNGANDSDSSSFSDDDEDGGNPFLLQGALSSIGPWMMADDRQNPEGLNSNSFDSHHHPSSTRFDLSPTSARSATEDEFAEMSPRSRLLWFSEFADNVEYSFESFGSSSSSSSFTPRQSHSHRGMLRSSSAAASMKTSGSKPPVRCASAKPSSQGRRGGVQRNSDSNGVKSKPGGAGIQIKKRPQSSGSRARKPAL